MRQANSQYECMPETSEHVCMSQAAERVCMYVCLRHTEHVCMYVSNIHTYTLRFCVKSSLQHVCMFEIPVFCHKNETYIHA